MLSEIEKVELESLAEDLQFMWESKKKLRRKIFKILRIDMENLRRINPWAYGKMERGYSNEIKDDQLAGICKTLLECSSKRR